MRRQIVAVAVAVLLSFVGRSAWGETLYTVTDLGTLPGGTAMSEARGINASGQVVGVSYASYDNYHAFLYSNGAMADLGTLGGSESKAFGINASGQVVGWSSTSSSGSIHAFRYTGLCKC